MFHIYELSQSDINSDVLQLGRQIFVNYFLDLYKDNSPEQLQMGAGVHEYLLKIFGATERDLNLKYKRDELEIRNLIVEFVQQKFERAQYIIIMVRKANIYHQQLCMRAGFIMDESVFDRSMYIKKIYDPKCYLGFSKKILLVA